jgi:hypothetical protein
MIDNQVTNCTSLLIIEALYIVHEIYETIRTPTLIFSPRKQKQKLRGSEWKETDGEVHGQSERKDK